VLTEATWQPASLRTLLESELRPYADPAGGPAQGAEPRVVLDGPDVALPSDVAVPIGMAIHELTTNAAKYGAFSNRAGRLAVSWTLADAPGPPAPGPPARQVLRFTWQESGGPPVPRPTRQGSGSRLLQRVLTAQVQAEVSIDYDPGGLRLVMIAPLPERNAALNPLAVV
jgi:two-component sensor histidine kinase